MTGRNFAVSLTAVAIVALAPVAVAGQTQSTPSDAMPPPQTAWGQPDLQGVWDFRTITPLERPENLGNQAFLTAEESAELEQEAVDRNSRLDLPSEVRAKPLPAGGEVGAYNNFWMDRGTRVVGDRRTSLIVHPPDGRIPALTAEGQSRRMRSQPGGNASPTAPRTEAWANGVSSGSTPGHRWSLGLTTTTCSSSRHPSTSSS